MRLDPRTSRLSIETSPSGGVVSVGGVDVVTPARRTVIIGSTTSISVEQSTLVRGAKRSFLGWNDGAPRERAALSGGADIALVARFSNSSPTARIAATVVGGSKPLRLALDASPSTDPDVGDVLTYAWDIDGDGEFDDAIGRTASRVVRGPARRAIGLRVTDLGGLSADGQVPVGAAAGAAGRGLLTTTRCGANAFVVRYYRALRPRGTPVVAACKRRLQHNWRARRPRRGVPADRFSAGWSGRFRFRPGPTRFRLAADDGARLWIDGKKFIEGWASKGRAKTVTINLTGGLHSLRVAYRDVRGPARISLRWTHLSGVRP